MEAAAQIAERLFQRAFHSEADRQDLIAKKARGIEQSIYASLMKDNAEALEIAGCVIGFMEDETMAHMLRCTLTGDISGANVTRQLLMIEIDAAVRRTAELRAIREVEAMTPEDFQPN